MPMMRRGPLDRYPVEWVLRQAGAHQASGSIEFHAARPITVHLRGGRIHHAEPGVAAEAGRRDPIDPPVDEATARARVVEVLATALGAGSGWYYHDPLGHHDDPGPWQWDTAALLLEARVRSHEDDTLGAWTRREVALHLPPAPRALTLGADAWAVVVALADPAQASEVRHRLGWTTERLVTALDDLVAAGALRPGPPTPSAVAGGADRDAAEEVAPVAHRQPGRGAAPRADADRPAAVGRSDPRQAAGLPARHVGPLTPPPVLAGPEEGGEDRRRPRRRLISSRRPS